MLVSAFITHKKAEHFADCQDRFSINLDTKSIAVSDGMSQSIFQKYWAQILTEKYTSAIDWVPNLESVRELTPVWYERVMHYLEEEEQAGRNPWRARGSIARGLSAGATILGIRFNKDEWTCDVLGDSCFVLVRDSHIESIITSEDVKAFDNYPDYYDSNPKKPGKGALKTETGKLLPGDIILLVSDPFSDYLLKNKGTGNESILVDRLTGINSHDEFETVVSEWRRLGMHNDDSTLVIIKQDKSDELNIIDGCVDSIDELIADEVVVSEESFDSKVQKKEAEPTDVKITLSQLKGPKFEQHMEAAVKQSVKKYKKGNGGLEKRTACLCRNIIDAIVGFFQK